MFRVQRQSCGGARSFQGLEFDVSEDVKERAV